MKEMTRLFFVLFVLSATIAGASLHSAMTYEAKYEKAAEEARTLRDANAVLSFMNWRQEAYMVRLEQRLSNEVRWVARAIVSETKNANEQRHIAWVVRNRFEMAHRGAGSYKDVVLHPRQFSAFNKGMATRQFYMNLTSENAPWPDTWAKAKGIAREAILSDLSQSPLPPNVTHFYSPVSMPGHRAPLWANRLKPYEVEEINPFRFRFFTNVN